MCNHNPTRRIQFCLAVALLTLLALAGRSSAAEPADGLEVHDVSLWVIDPGANVANARTAYPSALPVTVNSVRSGQAVRALRRVAPINLLTFHGPAAKDLDVDLRTSAGSFLAHWPPGDSLPNRLRWSGTPAYNLIEKLEDESELVFVDGDSWFNQARQGDALYVKRGARSERFLAYDVELKLDAPVLLEGGPDTYRVINTTDRALHDVLIARQTPAGVRVAWIDMLPAGNAAPAAAPKEEAPQPKKEAPEPKDDILDLFRDSVSGTIRRATIVEAAFKSRDTNQRTRAIRDIHKLAITQVGDLRRVAPATTQAKALAFLEPAQAADAKQPQAAPATKLFGGAPAVKKPADGGLFGGVPATKKPARRGLFGGLPATREPASTSQQGVEVTLSDPIPLDSPDGAARTAQSLAERLTKAGLTTHEVGLFVDHYGALFFESEALVVACRLDAAAVDEKIPLSIFPAPAKTVRVAMVLVRNADPQLGQQVDQLIVQLGDPKYSVREAAQARLLELGPLAFGALNKALGHTDLEIVMRAERILLNQKQTPDAKAGAGVRVLNGGQVIQAAPVIINR